MDYIGRVHLLHRAEDIVHDSLELVVIDFMPPNELPKISLGSLHHYIQIFNYRCIYFFFRHDHFERLCEESRQLLSSGRLRKELEDAKLSVKLNQLVLALLVHSNVLDRHFAL